MSDFVDYTETIIRDWMSQGSAMPSSPGSVYVALHTSSPSEGSPGSTEVGAGDYSRATTTAGTDWNTSLNPTQFSNANEVSFGEATSSWGTISHVSLWDSSTDGNCLAAFALDSSKSISSGDEATFPSGDLSFQID